VRRSVGEISGSFESRLTRARGYAVLGRDGRRVGSFIELAGPNGERIAIRHDGVFLWRRRVLPITTVANIFPKERAVLLNIDRRTLGGTTAAGDAVEGPPPPADEGADPSREWQERIERYISPDERSAGLRLPRPIAACLIVPQALERSAQQGSAGARRRTA
jgi:hypothetical protein